MITPDTRPGLLFFSSLWRRVFFPFLSFPSSRMAPFLHHIYLGAGLHSQYTFFSFNGATPEVRDRKRRYPPGILSFPHQSRPSQVDSTLPDPQLSCLKPLFSFAEALVGGIPPFSLVASKYLSPPASPLLLYGAVPGPPPWAAGTPFPLSAE